jgi:hypothetical protein
MKQLPRTAHVGPHFTRATWAQAPRRPALLTSPVVSVDASDGCAPAEPRLWLWTLGGAVALVVMNAIMWQEGRLYEREIHHIEACAVKTAAE